MVAETPIHRAKRVKADPIIRRIGRVRVCQPLDGAMQGGEHFQSLRLMTGTFRATQAGDFVVLALGDRTNSPKVMVRAHIRDLQASGAVQVVSD